MGHNRLKTKKLPAYDYAALAEKRHQGRIERERCALAFRQSLEAQFRASCGAPEAPLSAAVEALLSAAVSAHIEIAVTTERFLQGRASSKSLTRLGLCRSELRRSLRALGLADSGESPADPNAPPPGAPTDESMRAVVARFGGTPKEAASGAHEFD